MNFFKRTQPIVQPTSGIFLGTINDRRKTVDLRFDSEGSGSIVSPPGGGKTAKCFCPTLLTDPGTHIVFDPTLEIYSMTHVARELLGNDVYVVCPHPDDANEILHPDHQITDCGINFFGSSEFKGKPERVRENIKNRVELLLPDNLKTDAKTRFFEIDGRELLEFTCLDELNRGRDITLPNVRERILSGPAELNEAFVEAMESSAFAGELALLANGLNGVLTAAPQQFSGGFGCAKQAIGLYDGYSSVGRHVSGPGFDPALLKTGEKNVTLYICYPGERIKTHQRMAAATMTYLFQQVCKGRPGNCVTALVDEATEIGCFPIARFMNIGRKFNLRIFAAWQELEGQVDEVFGRSGVRQILSASELMWITSLRGPETCETFSKMIGMKGIENLSLNDRPQSTSTMPDQSFGRGHQSVPLIRPEDLQRMDQRLALVLVGANKPMLVNKVGYFEREAFRRIAGPNPYRG
ncbi:type IV secretory system conjugative DNA transfer family protein [Novipirellula sp.]|uniref:type IV secretory system conjugative DNA transfer family protein n=1 Tax=Novipirellula sp. TaxID=2795430 RepID=UPI003562435B